VPLLPYFLFGMIRRVSGREWLCASDVIQLRREAFRAAPSGLGVIGRAFGAVLAENFTPTIPGTRPPIAYRKGWIDEPYGGWCRHWCFQGPKNPRGGFFLFAALGVDFRCCRAGGCS